MNEYTTQAIVLTKDPVAEQDNTVTLFTHEYGKITVKTKSSRKITSKLSGHLEPGSLVVARVVEKHQSLLVDVLQTGRIDCPTHYLAHLAQLLPESVPEYELWNRLRTDSFPGWTVILHLLGWGKQMATCASCNSTSTDFFYTPSQEFYCQHCIEKEHFPTHQLLFVS